MSFKNGKGTKNVQDQALKHSRHLYANYKLPRPHGGPALELLVGREEAPRLGGRPR
jgi:hypothetical protein